MKMIKWLIMMCLIFQRYKFKSKSQHKDTGLNNDTDVFDIPKVQI